MESKTKTDESIAPGPPPHSLKTLQKALQKQKNQQIDIIKTKKLREFSTILEFPGDRTPFPLRVDAHDDRTWTKAQQADC